MFAVLRSSIASLACVVVAAAVGGCDDPCCTVSDDCSDGFACFEGRCAANCDVDSACNDGERCVGDGVCSADGDAQVCPFEEAR
jgi:hypothetical protein